MERRVLLVVLLLSAHNWIGGDAKVQFIFGDSLSDVGNNNYLSRGVARATLPWYGVDLGMGLPNGRFTNGRTIADIIGFDNTDSPCCKIFGRIRPSLTYTPASTLCKDRSKYVFWDEYHPTDKANEWIGNVIIKKLNLQPINKTTTASVPPTPPPAR